MLVVKPATACREANYSRDTIKGIVQPFELKCVTRLLRFAVKNWRSGNFFKSFLMTQSHERSIKPFTVA
jgi:hypothetical protein